MKGKSKQPWDKKFSLSIARHPKKKNKLTEPEHKPKYVPPPVFKYIPSAGVLEKIIINAANQLANKIKMFHIT